jgi:uncharacterized membrane protein YecN with MAPEG domain
MYRPSRRVTLTATERRKLRAIEQALTAEDPALCRLLDGPALCGLLDGTAGAALAKRRVRRSAWTYIVASVLLFVIGLGAADPFLIWVGGFLLLIGPAVVVCLAEFGSRWPPGRWR